MPKKRKLKALFEASSSILNDSLNESTVAEDVQTEAVPSSSGNKASSSHDWHEIQWKADEFDKLHTKMKVFCSNSDYPRSTKIQLLTLSPEYQSKTKFVQGISVTH